MHILIPVFDDPLYPRIQETLRVEALRCPDCGEPQDRLNLLIENRAIKPRYVVSCCTCKCRGPLGKNVEDAIKKWNAPPGFFEAIQMSWGRKRQKHPKRKT